MTEKWDVYTVDRVKTGKTVTSGLDLKTGEYRLVIGACIFNSNNQMLVQKRQTDKKTWPNYWDISVSGSVISGETSSQGVKREIAEELGLDIDIEGVLPQFSINYNGGFEDYYLIEKDIELSEVVIQEEEVQDVAWMSLDEIYELIEKDEFIPYHAHLIGLLFEMKTNYGSYKREG